MNENLPSQERNEKLVVGDWVRLWDIKNPSIESRANPAFFEITDIMKKEDGSTIVRAKFGKFAHSDWNFSDGRGLYSSNDYAETNGLHWVGGNYSGVVEGPMEVFLGKRISSYEAKQIAGDVKHLRENGYYPLRAT